MVEQMKVQTYYFTTCIFGLVITCNLTKKKLIAVAKKIPSARKGIHIPSALAIYCQYKVRLFISSAGIINANAINTKFQHRM